LNKNLLETSKKFEENQELLSETRKQLKESQDILRMYFKNLLINKWINYKLFIDNNEKHKTFFIPMN
jgi:hypothetical protein